MLGVLGRTHDFKVSYYSVSDPIGRPKVTWYIGIV
jgi:hypothetical protein